MKIEVSCANRKAFSCSVEYKDDRTRWCPYCYSQPVYIPDYHLEEELETFSLEEKVELDTACAKAWVDKIKPMLEASKYSLWNSDGLRRTVINSLN